MTTPVDQLKLLVRPEMAAAVKEKAARDGVPIQVVLRAAIAEGLGIENLPVVVGGARKKGERLG